MKKIRQLHTEKNFEEEELLQYIQTENGIDEFTKLRERLFEVLK